MSSYAGELSGIMYGEGLRKEREAKMAAEEASFAQRQQADSARQMAMNQQQQALSMAPIGATLGIGQEQSQVSQRNALPNAPMSGDDIGSYIKHTVMGNPQAAEKYFHKVVRSGTTKYDQDTDTIEAVSSEGHPIKITDASSHVGLTKPMSKKDKESLALKQNDDRRKQALSERAARKEISVRDKDIAGMNESANQAVKEFEAASKNTGWIQAIKDYFSGKTTVLPETDPSVAPIAKKVKEWKDKITAAEKEKAGIISSYADLGIDLEQEAPKEKAIPTTPPAENKPSGKGEILDSRGKKIVDLEDVKIRPITFATEADAKKSKPLPKGTVFFIGDKKYIAKGT